MKTLRTIASLLALTAIACGETPEDPDQVAPIGQVRGTISNPNRVAVGENLRTAVVWYAFAGGKQYSFGEAQGIAVAPTLPAGFELTLTDPPPAEAVMTLTTDGSTPRSLRGAFGRVVAYEDLNGNGKLDLVKQGDAAYLDRIVGEVGGDDQFNAVVWLEAGDVAQAEGFFHEVVGGYKPRAGYNLIIDQEGDGIDEHWASIDTPLSLVLGDSPEAQLFMCLDGESGEGTAQPAPVPGQLFPEGPGPNGVWPDPGDPNLTCGVAVAPVPAGEDQPAAEAYAYVSCTVQAEVCSLTRQCVTSYWSKPSDPVKAAGWPCPPGGGGVEQGGGQALGESGSGED